MASTRTAESTAAPAWVRVGFGLLAFELLVLGIPAAIMPDWFFHEFPFGRGWPAVTGSYNEHSVLDLGFGYVALGAVLVWAAASPGRELCRAAAFAALVGNVPHLVFHLGHTGDLPLGDDIAEVGLLALATVVSVAVFVAVFRRTPAPQPGRERPALRRLSGRRVR
jgi:hypothetical protein